MQRCHRVQADLTAWIDAELSRWRDARVRRHLSACADCAAAAAQLRATIETQRHALAAVAAAPDIDGQVLWTQLQRALSEAGADAVPVHSWRQGRGMARNTREPRWLWGWILRPMALAGAAVSVTVAVTVVLWRPDPGTVLAPLGVVPPPAAVTRAPELFKDYPLIEHLDALEHFDTVESEPLDEEQAAHRG
jgi:anti-sigma factor RsiW